MDAIERARDSVWLDDSWETDEIAAKVMEIIEQAANAKAAEELEGVFERSFVIAGVRHMDTEYVIDRIKELRKQLLKSK